MTKKQAHQILNDMRSRVGEGEQRIPCCLNTRSWLIQFEIENSRKEYVFLAKTDERCWSANFWYYKLSCSLQQQDQVCYLCSWLAV